jgi:SAM-dependent methyltransferase
MAKSENNGQPEPGPFWENKILKWERERYEDTVRPPSLSGRIAKWSSGSLRFRLQFAGDFLAARVAGKRIVELGCGSGHLAARLVGAGADQYQGFDIAANAVEEARRNANRAGLGDKAEFQQATITDLNTPDADIVFSLGLLDWLTDAELNHLFAFSKDADFFHSIAERRASPSQWLHRLYVHLAYGNKTAGYVPRYYHAQDIKRMIARHNPRPVNFFSSPDLSFGAFASSFPFTDGNGP